jgi:hypothetical protein
MKVTIDEINAAYEQVNEQYKLDGYPIKNEVIVTLDRNPLTDNDYFEEESDFVTVVKLRFVYDKSLGKRGSYRLASDDIEIIEED